MKLSITVLSSILAVCSVTIANPVDPSSTMSAEASTPTASSSGASADGSDSPKSPSLYKFKKYCGQLDATEVSLIEEIAKARVKSTKVFRLLEDRRFELAIREGLGVRKKEKLNSMSQVPSRKLSSAKANYEEFRQICEGTKYTMHDYASKLSHKRKEIRKLTKKLTSHSSFGVSPDDDYSPPKSLYGYQDCLKYFYNRLSQCLPQSEHDATFQDSGVQQQTFQS
ncbi:hypothetical protein BATDEDRAFT_24762 [Batrachochytrium dendrobatidis JAM81]|uniref:Uncharacterized protein n=2 Tax=Batrachochytrium dendrobatidis TaxID=109871 RepID=F4P2B3_BATDJ|nr:uncharacterized protein BATDEDRAFT_24762 [Batrachochytrium dendrobatidis JAM81]EGF80829.1 hypothetical protein BATDEDRAFT_24762 [Batrachochytrium dendrobatidis JAM81]OAJ42044.1 hypothetical protein BDEG_25548 [Batrachochytrium dendrobatidis JEL423]|eukprot:XP_006678536.1 hypothetical protein BATDEDRAFT_24762 [Batrachochytrium dendrobatidis JAM81]